MNADRDEEERLIGKAGLHLSILAKLTVVFLCAGYRADEISPTADQNSFCALLGSNALPFRRARGRRNSCQSALLTNAARDQKMIHTY